MEQSPEAAAADMRVCEFELRGIGLRGNLLREQSQKSQTKVQGVTEAGSRDGWREATIEAPAGTERETEGLRRNRNKKRGLRRRRRKRNKFKNRSWPNPRWSTRTAETEARRTAPVAAAAVDKIKRRGMYARACTPYAGCENLRLDVCMCVCTSM